MADQQYDPSEHTVPEVQAYLADADDAERERVLAAERDGQARVTLLGAQEPAEGDTGTEGTQDTSTKGQTFQEAAEAATPAEVGYVGFSPEAERTGRADKGLSQQNPAIMQGGPVPDARPTVDDTEAIQALKGEA